MREQPEDNVVCLAKADTPQQAHIWQNALESEGIRCKVVGDFLDAGLGDISSLRAEIWVHEDDREKARAILASHVTTDDETFDADEEGE